MIADFVREHNIDIIINCAAYTNVEQAEHHEISAYQLNAAAPKYLADEMKERNGWLVHISTDYVFGTEPYNTPCDEERKGTPVGVYGETKKHGEELIKDSGCRYVIIRTSWLYSEYGKNFMKTIINKIHENADEIKVVNDQTGTPTYAKDLAGAIIKIVNRIKDEDADSFCGIYNYSNEGVCSWYDFAYEICNEYKLSGTNVIVPCKTGEFKTNVKRPAYSVLDKTKIKETFNITIPHWRKSLELCISSYKVFEVIEKFNINREKFANKLSDNNSE